MKFNKIYIPEEITKSKGIPQIDIEKLSNVVAFVGRNGSGKTRILDLIQENIFENMQVHNIFTNDFINLPEKSEKIKKSLEKYKDILIAKSTLEIARKKYTKTKDAQEKIKISKDINAIEQKILRFQFANNNSHQEFLRLEFNLNAEISRFKQQYIRRINYIEIQQLQQSFEQNNNQKQQSFENLIDSIGDNINLDEFKTINQTSLSFLTRLPHKLTFDSFDCILKKENIEDRDSYKRFLSLKKFIENFLNKELSWDQKASPGSLTEKGNNVTFSGVWKLDNRVFKYSELSDGEKTLLAYALFFFLLEQNPKLSVKDSIILIDEPELHLHPNSEIDLIEGLKNVIGERGQLIIATHSINILSTLNYEEIFMVKNNSIHHPSQITPGLSLSELMSLEDRIHKLTDFLTSISTWAYVSFMAQCFSDPEVIESAKENDPQIEAFKMAVENNMSKDKNMLLDFGAGKGRLYEQIKNDYSFIEKISYSALEPFQELHAYLENLGASKIYGSYQDLEANKFDFILLCNVLHEIDITEWESTINKVIEALTPDGYLIIVEAKTLNKGEKIGTHGYLLLDLDEIKKLLDLENLPSSLKVGETKNNITCAVVSKKDLKKISKENIINCLNSLETNTFKKIEELRNENVEVGKSYGIGRTSAFLSQQHINAKLAVKELMKQNKLSNKEKGLNK